MNSIGVIAENIFQFIKNRSILDLMAIAFITFTSLLGGIFCQVVMNNGFENLKLISFEAIPFLAFLLSCLLSMTIVFLIDKKRNPHKYKPITPKSDNPLARYCPTCDKRMALERTAILKGNTSARFRCEPCRKSHDVYF